ncbi:Fructose-2,6-bisphosphatase [Tulasnella sp. 403]|nr:Fructose-2,6-bisphosphatase [Tulasnella sp. 403]
MSPNRPQPSIDLKEVDRALQSKGIEFPAGLTPGGSINTISVVPLAPTPTILPTLVESPDSDKLIPPSLDAVLNSKPASGKGLEVPDVHYGARSIALKQFDEARAASRMSSACSTPPRSVAGIGNKVGKPDYSEAKIVLALVGLPARGKSYLSNKLMRYLKWLEYKVRVFNVGQLRRTRALEKEKSLIFLESLCDDPAVIASNIVLKASAGDPDYKAMSHEEAVADFTRRIKQYEEVYETVEPFEWEGMEEEKFDDNTGKRDTEQEREARRKALIEAAARNAGKNNPRVALITKAMARNVSYLKVINVGRQMDIVRINGYLQSRIAYYLMNLHLKPRSIFMSRHGESQYNVEGRIGGDAPLSPRGEEYAKSLPGLILDNIGTATLKVWTSTLQRTIQTASYLPYEKLTWKSLDELDAGVCDGMTYEEIEEHYPDDFANRDEDKFNYRYRGGESYRDVVVRLEPVIMELERQENILIIGHQAIIRCLYKVPIAAVSTHRPKPGTETDERGDPATAIVNHKSSARDYFGDKSKD